MEFSIRARYPFIIALSIVVLGSAFFIARGYRKILSAKMKANPAAALERLPILSDFNLTQYSRQGRQKEFQFQGKTLSLQGNSKKIGPIIFGIDKVLEVKDATITFYRDGRSVSTLTAQKVRLDIPLRRNINLAACKKMDFSGDAALITIDRRTLFCNKLTWDRNNNYILASGNCTLGYEGKIIRADTIKTDVELKNFSIEHKKHRRLSLFKRRS